MQTPINPTSKTAQPPPLSPPPPTPKNNNHPTPTPTQTSLAAALVHALHASTVYITPSNLSVIMRQSLNLSRTQIALPLNTYRLINAIFLIPGGYVLDHWGPRTPLLISISIAGVLGCVYPFCGRLWELVLLQGLFAGTKVIGGLGAMLMLVSRNFEMDEMEERVERDGGVEDKGSRRNRNGWGVSMGVSVILSGYSAAGVIAPIVVGSLAERWGWRVASGFMGGVFLGVGVPVCWRFLKIGEYRKGGVGGEERMGLLRDEGSAVVERKDGSGKVGNGKLEPVFTRGFVIMMVIVVLFAIPLHVVFDYFIDFLKTDIKYSLKAATMHYAAFNLVALVAKLFVGPLGDKYDKYALIILFAMVTVIGTLFLFDFGFSLAGGISFTVTKSLRKIALFVPIYSIGYAAIYSLTTAALAGFGQSRLGIRSNVYQMLFMVSAAFGSYMGGFIRTQFGSYKWVFVMNFAVSVGVVLASCVFKWQMDQAKCKGVDGLEGSELLASR